MKKTSTIIFVLCLYSFVSLADERMIAIQSTNYNTRSIVALPEATIEICIQQILNTTL